MPRVKHSRAKRVAAVLAGTEEKFAMKQAKQRYEEVFLNQQLLPDKGFHLPEDISEGVLQSVQQSINEYGWQQFCAARPRPDVELVREFYANFTPDIEHEVVVRGVSIPITPASINELYKLPNHFPVADYEVLLIKGAHKDTVKAVSRRLTVDDVGWLVSKNGKHTCRREWLTPEAKIWFFFLRYSLMPTAHTSTISMERMYLIYAMCMKETIDVGKIIFRELRDCANKRVGCAYFPSLITQLCHAHGVITSSLSTKHYALGAITSVEIGRVSGVIPYIAEKSQPKCDDIGHSGKPVITGSGPPLPVVDQHPLSCPQHTRVLDILATMYEQQQTYWEYVQERDDSICHGYALNSAQPYALVPQFPLEILQPWKEVAGNASNSDPSDRENDEG